MGKIFCIMGKSASGKDSIYSRLLADETLALSRIVPYTTRPRREGEQDGREYRFVDEAAVQALDAQGKIIELRAYNTVYGVWKYFTVDDGRIDDSRDYLYIVTLEGYRKMCAYFSKARIVPIYIEVEDGERLQRAAARERQQKKPQYEEMCRRFLADAADFSEEKLREAGISRRFANTDMDRTVKEIASYIKEMGYGDQGK